MNRLLTVAAGLLIGTAAPAHADGPGSARASSRYTLKPVRAEVSTTSDTGRYSVRARFAPAERAGELREGEHFALIGRFAKAGVGCGPTGGTVFRNGFEGS